MCIVLRGIAMNSTLFSKKSALGHWMGSAGDTGLLTRDFVYKPRPCRRKHSAGWLSPQHAPYHFIGRTAPIRNAHRHDELDCTEKNIQVMYVPFHTNGECLNALNGEDRCDFGAQNQRQRSAGAPIHQRTFRLFSLLGCTPTYRSALQDTENIKTTEPWSNTA